MPGIHQENEYLAFSSIGSEPQLAQIAVETEVALTVNGKEWLGFHCSPEHLENLAVGFLFNERFIDSAEEVSSVTICEGFDNIDVWLNHAINKPERWNRTSGCQGGVSQRTNKGIKRILSTEKHEIMEIQQQVKAFLTTVGQLGDLRNGVHTTMLLDGLDVISISNDIGRHNTLDKIAGDCMLGKKTPKKPVLLSTGRVSSDMVLKAERMGVALVISLHSISSMAIGTASDLGVTLIGHARLPKLNVYTHPELITG